MLTCISGLAPNAAEMINENAPHEEDSPGSVCCYTLQHYGSSHAFAHLMQDETNIHDAAQPEKKKRKGPQDGPLHKAYTEFMRQDCFGGGGCIFAI